jgi:uncharacterized protein (DUF2342 family)
MKKVVFPCVHPDGACSSGGQTMASVIFGVAIGALCAFLRYRVLMMLPLGGLLAVGAVLRGIILHVHPGVIASEAFGSIAASQLIYVSISLTHHLVRSRKLMPKVQAAIGQELRAQPEVPRGLPPDLSALITQLRLA